MALTHAQAVAGKLEAIRLEFEWQDGTFHPFKVRRCLPKDRRDVHGKNIILTKEAQLVWSCYEVVLMLCNMVMFLSFLQDFILMEVSMMEAANESCSFRAEDRESEALDYLYSFSKKTFDVPWGPVDPRLRKQLCTRSFDTILPDRCSQGTCITN